MYSSFLICLVKTTHSNTIPCLFYFLNMTFFAHEILVLCYSSIFFRFLVSFADQTIPSDSLNKMLKTGQKNIPFVDPRLFVFVFRLIFSFLTGVVGVTFSSIAFFCFPQLHFPFGRFPAKASNHFHPTQQTMTFTSSSSCVPDSAKSLNQFCMGRK